MKAFLIALALSMPFSYTAMAQKAEEDSTGLPGDNFSLEGALELFSKAQSPEDFEQQLNAENNGVNNLDLNNDGDVDFIRVEDRMDGNAHALVLQVAINENETQDIAVIEIEKNSDSSAILQIVGDNELYGEEKIVEPFSEVENGGKKGPSPEVNYVRVIVNVWVWPCVRFIYGPHYVRYASPWHWRMYPGWYHPWHPRPYRIHYARCAPYRRNCHVVVTHRVVRAHGVYKPHRRTSVVVHSRNNVRVYKGPAKPARTAPRPAGKPGGGHRGGHGGRHR